MHRAYIVHELDKETQTQKKEIRNGKKNKKGHPSTSRVIIFLMTVSSEIFVYVCMKKRKDSKKGKKEFLWKKDLYPQQTCEREKSFQRDFRVE
jgi:hypothetical protein